MNEDQIIKPIPKTIALKIVAKHFPEYSKEDVEYKGGGSFSVFTVGEEIVLRLSKGWMDNNEIRDSFKQEKAILDEIRPYVSPHTIPDHLSIFVDDDIFDGSIWVTKQFNGQALKDLDLTKNTVKVTRIIADFLSKLHSVQADSLQSISTKKLAREKIIDSWHKNYEFNQREHFHKLSSEEQRYMHRVYEQFLSIADQMKPIQVITHGDFDHSNCLWNTRENHLQIIDFEDIGYGHAVGDFCTWYGNYGEKFLEDLIEQYQLPTDKFFKERAIFYWLRIPLAYYGYAQEYHNEKFIQFGKYLLKENMEKYPL